MPINRGENSGSENVWNILMDKVSELKSDIRHLSERYDIDIKELTAKLESRTRDTDRELFQLKETVTGKVSEYDGKDTRLATLEKQNSVMFPWYCKMESLNLVETCQKVKELTFKQAFLSGGLGVGTVLLIELIKWVLERLGKT